MAVVIKSFTVIAPVNAAEAALVKVRLLMFTEVPVIAPVEPAVRPKSNVPAPSVIPKPKVIAAPAAVPPALVVSMAIFAVRTVAPVKLTAPPVVVIFPPNWFCPVPLVTKVIPPVPALERLTPFDRTILALFAAVKVMSKL